WFLHQTTMIGGNWLEPSQPGSDLHVAGVNDFNGDGRPDLVLQHRLSGAVTLFFMNGLSRTASQQIPIASNTPWRVVATGDIDNDGHADLTWQHATSRELYVWFMRPNGGVAGHGGPGGSFLGGYIQHTNGSPLTLGSSTQRVAGAVDLNGDNRTDLVIQDDA